MRTLLGRRRFLPNLHSANRGLRFEAERIARNTPIQGTAADILKLAMVDARSEDAASRARGWCSPCTTSWSSRCPRRRRRRRGERIREEMAGAMKLAVPLVVDVGYGASWAKAH